MHKFEPPDVTQKIRSDSAASAQMMAISSQNDRMKIYTQMFRRNDETSWNAAHLQKWL